MNIILIGYGKMGHEIEQVARERGHSLPLIIDLDNRDDLTEEKAGGADVAIEFTGPDGAFGNISRCFDLRLPVVSGSTGWLDHYDEVVRRCREEGQAFFYASNFSLGVNILFHLNERLASIMARYPEYDVRIEETHHIHKKDAPSGTAITLAEAILARHPRKERWLLGSEGDEKTLPITAHRRDEVPGIHTVRWESEMDLIELTHSAKNRRGFALGAVLAAEFLAGKKGCFGMDDLLGLGE